MDEVRLRLALDLIEPPYDGWLATYRLIQYVVKMVTGEDVSYDEVFPSSEQKPTDPDAQFNLDMVKVAAWNSAQAAQEEQKRMRKEATEAAFRRYQDR